MLGHVVSGLNAGHAAADHEDADAGVHLAVQNVYRVHDVFAVDSFEGNVQRRSAGRQDHGVGIKLFDELRRDGSVQADVAASFLGGLKR